MSASLNKTFLSLSLSITVLSVSRIQTSEIFVQSLCYDFVAHELRVARVVEITFKLDYQEKLHNLCTKMKLIICTKCLNNTNNIADTVYVNHREEWYDLYTKMKFIICTKCLNNNIPHTVYVNHCEIWHDLYTKSNLLY